MKISTVLAAAVLASTLVSSVDAGVILSPTSVTTDMGNRFMGAIGNTIDQSGLVTPFTSGVTDFDVYAPTSTSTQNASGHQWWGALNTLGVTDFDLGATYNVARLAFWNANAFFGMNQFRVLIDDNAAFSSATDMGTFNAAFNQPLGQVFDLTDGTGRYVRFEHLSTHSSSSNMGEVAFDVSSAASIPEPGSFAILVVAAIGVAFNRRRQRQGGRQPN